MPRAGRISPITILAGEDLEPYRRVKFNGAAWVYAQSGLSDVHQAVTIDRIASGGYGPAVIGAAATIKIEASGAISAGAAVYGSANGRVTTGLSGHAIGVAATAATGAGAVIEVIPKLQEAK